MADDAAWLDTLPITHREPGLYFVHAGIIPGIPLEKQPSRELIWMREPFLSSRADHGAIVIHGHTPEREGVVFRKNRVGVDTGACFRGGKLSCLVIDGAVPRCALSFDGEKILTTFPS